MELPEQCLAPGRHSASTCCRPHFVSTVHTEDGQGRERPTRNNPQVSVLALSWSAEPWTAELTLRLAGRLRGGDGAEERRAAQRGSLVAGSPRLTLPKDTESVTEEKLIKELRGDGHGGTDRRVLLQRAGQRRFPGERGGEGEPVARMNRPRQIAAPAPLGVSSPASCLSDRPHRGGRRIQIQEL